MQLLQCERFGKTTLYIKYNIIFAINDFDIFRAIGVIVVAILEVYLEPVWKKKHFLYFETIVFQKSVNHHHPQCLKLTAKLY